jgi:hypothetical protein
MERSQAAWTHMIELFAAHRPLWAVGSLYLALLPGVMAQWLIDPEHAPSGRDLAEALRTSRPTSHRATTATRLTPPARNL